MIEERYAGVLDVGRTYVTRWPLAPQPERVAQERVEVAWLDRLDHPRLWPGDEVRFRVEGQEVVPETRRRSIRTYTCRLLGYEPARPTELREREAIAAAETEALRRGLKLAQYRSSVAGDVTIEDGVQRERVFVSFTDVRLPEDSPVSWRGSPPGFRTSFEVELDPATLAVRRSSFVR